jgi:hypothetical protein
MTREEREALAQRICGTYDAKAMAQKVDPYFSSIEGN